MKRLIAAGALFFLSGMASPEPSLVSVVVANGAGYGGPGGARY